MCGIAGVVGADGPVSRGLLRRMRDRLVHRGPDDEGEFYDDDAGAALGHRRLSILDLSERGRQPMANEDGSIRLVYNGEIYNFKDLRDQLASKGHRFSSHTDTETIVHGYEEWGDGVVDRLRGMFAFGLWDLKTRRLLLARDRLGIKPLVYAASGERLAFASEPKALLEDPRIGRELDLEAIDDYLVYRYIPSPATAWRSIRKLRPGHLLVWQNGRASVRAWWTPTLSADSGWTESAAASALRERMADAVRSHLVADVPVGVFLSGGTDSASVTALAALASPEPIRTFTIGFDVETHDETEPARVVAQALGTRHVSRRIHAEMASTVLERILDAFDEPFGDASAVPTLYVSKAAREETTVALSGEGGDELFAGYRWYGRFLRGEGSPRRAGLSRLLRRPPAGGLDADIDRYARLMGAILGRERRRLVTDDLSRRLGARDELWLYRRNWREDLDPLSRLQYLDLMTFLPENVLTKIDRASMAVSLESRVPLLDHPLVEALARVPAAVRNPGGAPKHLLRLAMKDLLPAEVFDRPKRGFSAPIEAWVDRGADWSRDPRLDEPPVRELLSGAAIEDLRSHRLKGAKYWRVLYLALWLAREARRPMAKVD